MVPDVFSHSNTLNSDVWNSDVVFNKEQLYLIEADSGKGKSTFCSYILGDVVAALLIVGLEYTAIKNYKKRKEEEEEV